MKRDPGQQGLFVKNEDAKGNKIIFSQLLHFEREEKHNPYLAIKYVLDGTENYTINRNDYKVRNGHYLLVNSGQAYQGFFQSNKPVKGMCFYLDHALINDAFHNLTLDQEALLNNPFLSKSYRLFDMYEDVYGSQENPLGLYLAEICERLGKAEEELVLGQEVYYSLASKLLEAQGIVYNKISGIKAEKYSTQKELYKRVLIGKRLIEDSFQQNIEIEAVAEQATLSQFHFFRIFKQAFGISPYQYLLQFRLKNALAQLQKGGYGISAIAYANGFTDIYSFSKCFKKAYGFAPSRYLAANKQEMTNEAV